MQIVECVPNFSNGRDPDVYNGIADVIRGVPGVRLLDVSADPDHNRTVITYMGGPTAVEEAAFRAIAKAAELINLDKHRGEHPRLGATDVCPFIPVRGVTVADCVQMSHRLGKRVGQELGIAVYLYGDAATRPEREKLADIRKGEYELWKTEVATNPARKPDYGPAEAKPCGATVIGVRPFLIAYNLYLNSDKVAIAEEIARAVRFISGGFRYVQAKGFLVEGQAQVSMNLNHYEKTPIYRVQEAVKREAARYGLTVTKAELVGLTPQKALIDVAQWYLQIDGLRDEQILENQLHSGTADSQSNEEKTYGIIPEPFLAAVASGSPTPGGGAVAALAGALAAALAQMVAGLTIGRKKYADVSVEASDVLSQAMTLREQLTQAISQDSAAFEQVMAVQRNKELDETAKAAALEAANIGAGEVPLRVARLSRDVAMLAHTVTRIGNINAASDAGAAAILSHAALQIAALNVRTNAVNLQNRELAQLWTAEIENLEAEVRILMDESVMTAGQRGGF